MDRKYRILIVDDEAPLRAGLQTYLELEGYEADTAASAEEALTLDLRSYDLILLDIMMGDMSGIEMAAKLKADKATADLPIIFLTARDSDDDMVSGLNLGADDYIAKPYSIKNVLARIGAVLRRSDRRKGGAAGGAWCATGLRSAALSTGWRSICPARSLSFWRFSPSIPGASSRARSCWPAYGPEAQWWSTARSMCISPACGARSDDTAIIL